MDEKRWFTQSRYLHALNYCILLPGPEAVSGRSTATRLAAALPVATSTPPPLLAQAVADGVWAPGGPTPESSSRLLSGLAP